VHQVGFIQKIIQKSTVIRTLKKKKMVSVVITNR